MKTFQDWLSKNGKHVIMAIGAGLFAANQAYPFIDPHLLNGILAGLAGLGLYSNGGHDENKWPRRY